MSKRNNDCDYSTRLKKLKKKRGDVHNQKKIYDSSDTDEWENFSSSSQFLSKNSTDESDSSMNALENSTKCDSFAISSEVEYETSEDTRDFDIDSDGSFIDQNVCERSSIESFDGSEIESGADINSDGKTKNKKQLREPY